MTDIMEHYKNTRFVITSRDVASHFDQNHLVVLADISFWAAEYDNLLEWCNQNNCDAQGMTVDIPDEQTLSLFCLRWT